MSHVEAKASFGKSLEETIELDRIPAVPLARVHVLDRDNSPERRVGLGVRDRVGVKNDCIDTRRESPNQVNELSVGEPPILARGVDREIAEREGRIPIWIVDEASELRLREGRKLGDQR